MPENSSELLAISKNHLKTFKNTKGSKTAMKHIEPFRTFRNNSELENLTELNSKRHNASE